MKRKITIIIPVFDNRESVVKSLLTISRQSLKAAKYFQLDIDLLIVNDGSTYNIEKKLIQLCKENKNISLINFTRNYGKESALLAGLSESDSDAVIVMDSDLQHPVNLINKMIKLWVDGNDVIDAHKSNRGVESKAKNILVRIYYYIFKKISGMDMSNHSDYKLLDRKVVDQYLSLPENKRFFRGMIFWMGYSTERISFNVPNTIEGKSNWSTTKLINYSIQSIILFSAKPLYIVTWLGLVTLIFSFFLSIFVFYKYFIGEALDGFPTITLLILLFSSLIMIALGIIGLYISQIYDEIKARPQYIIKNKLKNIQRP